MRTQRKAQRAIACLACALAVASGPAGSADVAGARAAAGGEVTCDLRNVVVRSPERDDALNACEGARDAITFLASQGFVVTSDIRIEVVTQLPDALAGAAAGCYLELQGRVLVLSYADFRKRETWLGAPVSRVLYRSLVSHEVAHSVASCNFKVRDPSVQAKEYIAWVATFSTMPPAQRAEILARQQGEGFEGDWQIRAAIFLADPVHFGVQAYRHFQKLPDGHDYLQKVLAGKALAR